MDTDTDNNFEKNGYVVIRNVLDPELLKYLATQIKMMEKLLCLENNVKPSDYAFGDSQTKTSFTYYSALTTETLLDRMNKKMEKIVNKSLFPCYSYLRIYYKDSTLAKHTDRPSCEYSATICITIDAEPWDIWFETKEGIDKQIFLQPGDMIVYKGTELVHWRNKYEHNEQIQVFLHYVDAYGPYAEYKYDKRLMLATCRN
jgi:lambda repressor-like predicted transcriptional regulator